MLWAGAYGECVLELNFFDLHTDTLSVAYEKGISLFGELDGSFAVPFKKNARLLAVFTDENMVGKGMARFEKCVMHLQKHSDIGLCVTYADAEKAYDEGKSAAFVAVEGGAVLDERVENIEKLYKYGVRVMSFIWNEDNCFGCGAMTKNDTGLTARGKDALMLASQLGMVLDVSHMSRKSFFDAIDIFDGAVIATHSNCDGVCSHPRNLTDGQISALLKRGGVIGINLHAPFVSAAGAFLTKRFSQGMGALLRHYEHICALGGSENVCIGTDFDGTKNTICGVKDISDMDKLYSYFRSRGLSAKEADGLFFGNADRFFKRNLIK